jgi:sugar phosphate isomerase/epimerase
LNFADFGIDSVSMAGSLETRLAAARDAGFSQVMISANDIVGHPSGTEAGVRAIRESRLRVTGLEALRDFEGLTGKMHEYKVDVAKSMLGLCGRIGGRVLLTEASTSVHADTDPERLARDLRKLAFLAIDAFDVIASGAPLDDIDAVFPRQICLVQLSDFMVHGIRSPEEQAATATHFRVFPGEGAHSEQVARFVVKLEEIGYLGDYSFDVYNSDYLQMPPEVIADRARRAADWLGETVLRRTLPVPNMERLRAARSD